MHKYDGAPDYLIRSIRSIRATLLLVHLAARGPEERHTSVDEERRQHIRRASGIHLQPVGYQRFLPRDSARQRWSIYAIGRIAIDNAPFPEACNTGRYKQRMNEKLIEETEEYV